MSNSKMFHIRTKAISVTLKLVGTDWSCLVFRDSSKQLSPSWCRMLLYSPVTSIEMGKAPSGIGAGHIKTLLLRRKHDYFGDKFGVLQQPLRPGAAAAAIEKAAIKKLTKIFFYCAFLLRQYIYYSFRLRRYLVYCGARKRRAPQ